MLKRTVVRDTWVPYFQPTKGYGFLFDAYSYWSSLFEKCQLCYGFLSPNTNISGERLKVCLGLWLLPWSFFPWYCLQETQELMNMPIVISQTQDENNPGTPAVKNGCRRLQQMCIRWCCCIANNVWTGRNVGIGHVTPIVWLPPGIHGGSTYPIGIQGHAPYRVPWHGYDTACPW
jgi:hypothetical protein